MLLKEKTVEKIATVMLTAGALIGTHVGYQTLDHDWDDQRSDNAEQIVSGFEKALDELSALKQENLQLDVDQKLSFLEGKSAPNYDQKYQENLSELNKKSSEYAKIMLATPDISERDFENLATQFNDIGLSDFSNIKVNPENADGLKECQVRHYSANASNTMHSDIAHCMEDDVKFVMAPFLGAVGLATAGLLLATGFLFASNTTSSSRYLWTPSRGYYLPDNLKSKNNTSGEKLGARLKRCVGLGPKRPQN